MIPRILHRIWLGPEEISEENREFWRRWRLLHPTWLMLTWGEEPSFPYLLPLQNQEEFDLAKSWAAKADILRYEILYRYGGVYVDCDVEPLRSLDLLLDGVEAFAGFEDENYICNAVMGGIAGHHVFRRLVDELPASVKLRITRPITEQTGPGFLTEVMFPVVDPKVVLYPPVVFYPYHHTEKHRRGESFPHSYTMHHWNGAW